MSAATIVYEVNGSQHGLATGRLAHELASCMAARPVPVSPAWQGRRRTARRLAAVAAREAATLLVVAVDERRPALLGSVSAELVRAAACPVVLVPPRMARARGPLLAGDHVLWAVADHRDGGCADVAAGMARALALPLTVAHVLPGHAGSDQPARLAGWLVDGLLDTLNAHARAVEDRLMVRMSAGDAGVELQHLCDAEGAALAVLGCRGRGPLAAAVLGSVSSHLARHGATPVVVCPPAIRQPRYAAPTESTAA